MSSDHIENALKKELGRIEKQLKRVETLRLAALIGSAAVVGFALSTVSSYIPLLAGMAAGGVLLNAMARHVVSRKK
jgi:xanthine/uracil/vitamin C permease (AzgA family)